MLSIRGLSVQIRDKKILNGIDLSVKPWRNPRDHGAKRFRQKHTRKRHNWKGG